MNEQEKKQRETILKLLTEKSVMKQDVYTNTISVFNDLKDVLKEKAEDLSHTISKIDKRVIINYKESSLQSSQLKVAGDTLDLKCIPMFLSSTVHTQCSEPPILNRHITIRIAALLAYTTSLQILLNIIA